MLTYFSTTTSRKRHTIQTLLRLYGHDIYRFDGKPLQLQGIIKLPLEFRDEDNKYIVCDVEFLVVDISSSYNILLRHNSINVFAMVVSMAYLKAKFLTPNGVGICKRDQQVA